MTSFVTPRINTAFIFYISLVSQSDTKLLQSNPTLAIGDVKISKDGGVLTNITTLPVVTPVGGKSVKVALSAPEMNADNIVVLFSDVSGDEWCDISINIQTTINQIDDIDDAVWSNATRTLTQSAAQIVASVTGSNLSISRYDTWTQTIAGLGNISSYTKIFFTIKDDEEDSDADSIIQIALSNPGAVGDGLQIVNGVAASDKTKGTIVVTNAVTGSITITISEVITGALETQSLMYYDLKILTATSARAISRGNVNVGSDITHSIT